MTVVLPWPWWELNGELNAQIYWDEILQHHVLPLINVTSGILQYDNAMPRTSTGRKEGNVLFNDALNTFYLRLYGVGHMVKDHSDSEKGNPLPPRRLLLSINSKGSFICTIPQTG